MRLLLLVFTLLTRFASSPSLPFPFPFTLNPVLVRIELRLDDRMLSAKAFVESPRAGTV